MHSMYPAGPSSVPPRLTEPSATYRRHAWLAMAGLLVFIAVYFGLLFWFLKTAYRLFSALLAGNSDVFASLIAGGCALFLAVFMLKALVFNKRAHDSSRDIELKPEEQPELFAFLYRLADEAGAPRPRRVYLSAQVNACVFYDLSLLNLVFPSRKNLEIGMGLVNVLNLGELKAVLAHEFGHFAQRTMAVGRWVYVAQQIAGHIVSKRDALDSFLAGLSRVDFRIAWVGWILSLIVWSIRSLVEIVFRGVVLAQRALSREMEYQADLVAASLTGSDALIHALHRLGAADEAWNSALNFISREAEEGRPVSDLFAVQLRVIEHMRTVLADPSYGQSPERPQDRGGEHRVFRAELAQPPQMWSTHPSNEAREANVKRVYIPCDVDERPALDLLRDAQELKVRITRSLLTGTDPQFAPIEESLRRLDEQYDMLSMSRRFRGTYLGRSIVRRHARVADLYPPASADVSATALDALYPHEHGERIESLRELEQQRAMLEAIVNGDLKATGGVVQWRGSQVPRKSLPNVLAELDAEIVPLRDAVETHDRMCRGAHLAAAEAIGPGWTRLLRGQLEVLHYAEHAKADVTDAYGLLHNTYEVVTADRRVSSSELQRLIAACNQVHSALANVFSQATQIRIDAKIAEKLGAATWPEALNQEFTLSRATDENINAWMKVVDGWLKATVGPLSALQHAALEALLAAEDEVAAQTRSGERRPEPTVVSAVPGEYVTLLPGAGRKLQKKLGWWDRFQTADGWVPGTARVLVAGGIVGTVFAVGGAVGQSTVSVYNGLDRAVTVRIDEGSATIEPFQHAMLTVPNIEQHHIEARIADTDELIESFDGEASVGTPHLVYNIASAAPLVQWTAVYGSKQEIPEQLLGTPRWTETTAEHVFEEPPESISGSKSGGGTRAVLSAFSNEPPIKLSGLLREGDDKGLMAMAEAHARWDSGSNAYLIEWMARAEEGGKLPAIIAQRLKRAPTEVATLRMEQEAAKGAAHDAVCARHRGLAAAQGAEPALQYIALRCIEDIAARDAAAISAHSRWPKEPWLIYAAGYAHANRGDWSEALPLLEQAMRIPGMAESVAPDIARMKRATGDAGAMQSMAASSSYLGMMLALETGKDTEGTWAATYRHLATGDLALAVEAAGDDGDTLGRLLPLLAASDGADRSLVARAMAMPPPSKQDPVGAWMRVALAMRDGGDVAAMRKLAESADPEDAPAIGRFLDAVDKGASVPDAEAALGEIHLRARGIAYAAAVVLMGERCPAQWRMLAKQLLFAAERPHFA
jgi:Zn-dependent protease with chaperone function